MSNTTTINDNQPAFGKLRNMFWPIYHSELKKFVPMGLMMFFVLFNYTALRSMKDTLVVPVAGTGVISFLKGYVVIPCAIMMMIYYSKMVNHVSKEKVFYAVMAPFLGFFAIFAAIIYPNIDFFHASPEWTSALQAEYPRLQYLFPVIGNWSYTLFYVFSELWGSMMLSLMFWQFANEITKTCEAKRFYSMFGIIANFSMIAVGLFPVVQKFFNRFFVTDDAQFDFQLYFTLGIVIFNCLALAKIYHWITKNVLTDKNLYDPAHRAPKKKKEKLTIKESFSYILKSKYLGMIALLVICYGIVIGCVELAWKEQASLYYPLKKDYKNFMDTYLAITGVVTIICMFALKGVVGKHGWLRGAIMTPLMMLVTSALFFAFIFAKDAFDPMFVTLGVSSLFMAVIVGGVQNVLSKGTKYALFDPTKEMAYIPLDHELRSKGKAAVDVVGGRLGKGASGYINSTLLIITAGSVNSIMAYIAAIVVVLLVVWFYAVGGLSKMYQTALSDHEAEVKAHADEKQKAANTDKKKPKTSPVKKAA